MGFKFSLILMLVIAGMTGVGYWYYNDTQARMAILNENNAKLETAIALNEETITSLQADYQRVNEQLNTINEQYQAIRRQNQVLAAKLEKIDLESAAVTNPEAIERAVNNGTKNAGRCFELLSGAELNEKERNAKNDIAFNKECPWLYDDYKSRGLLNESAEASGN